MSLLITIISTAFTVYYWLLIIRILLSWLPQLARNDMLRPVISFVFDITEPFLSLFRRMIPMASAGGVGFDFSPLIAIITLGLLQRLVLFLLQLLV